jgi:hypothetical protein
MVLDEVRTHAAPASRFFSLKGVREKPRASLLTQRTTRHIELRSTYYNGHPVDRGCFTLQMSGKGMPKNHRVQSRSTRGGASSNNKKNYLIEHSNTLGAPYILFRR